MRIPTRVWVPVVALTLLLATAGSSSAYEIDYATYDARVTDLKGVVTEVTDFGFWAGANVLTARRGDGTVDIPFRKIQSIEIGAYLPEKGLYPLTVTAKSGKAIECQLERIEGQRLLGGESEIGAYRIRLGNVRRLELLRLSHVAE
jgi:hypothetical protein